MQYFVEPLVPTQSRFFDCHCQCCERAGETMCRAHIHDWVEILYCLSGSMTALLGSRDYPFAAHDLLIIPSHEVHQITTLTNETHEYIVIKFRPDLMITSMQLQSEYRCILPFLVRGGPYQKHFSAAELEDSEVPRLARHFAEEYSRMQYGYEIALKADFYGLILWILRRWHETSPLPDRHSSSPEQMQRMQPVLDYIGKNFAQPITAADAARLFHVSYSYFSKLFSKAAGCSFSDYVTAVRLSAAEQLLITTEKSITEISFETGFSDLSYFTRRFTAKNGLTPRAYRKKYRCSSGGLPSAEEN
ncbi:MAG: AraC family transcriptional regulator [Firmicutes bacterium]|nr:AraC family transcriptional regulator [Bacillota bacterium]